MFDKRKIVFRYFILELFLMRAFPLTTFPVQTKKKKRTHSLVRRLSIVTVDNDVG